MQVRIDAFHLPKDGNGPLEYEDACWPVRSTTRVARTVRCAVADGATEASFSGLWAGMLVRAFGRGRIGSIRLLDTLTPLQAAWWNEVRAKPLPWYAEEKLRSGAFSSLLGLTLNEDRRTHEVSWSALAIGDSCLFMVSAGELQCSFPLDASDQFDNRPHLIASQPARNAALETVVCRQHGIGRPGDTWYLLTDALACWFLARHEAGEDPGATLHSLDESGPGQNFTEWIVGERRKQYLRNDDVSMLRVSLG